jgi:hypothetical protein
MQAVCPGCSEVRVFDPDVQVGDVVSCDSCAGVLFRLVQDHGAYHLRELPQASCPVCGVMPRLPDHVQAGASTEHCGQTFRVTYAYGTYALEHRNPG